MSNIMVILTALSHFRITTAPFTAGAGATVYSMSDFCHKWRRWKNIFETVYCEVMFLCGDGRLFLGQCSKRFSFHAERADYMGQCGWEAIACPWELPGQVPVPGMDHIDNVVINPAGCLRLKNHCSIKIPCLVVYNFIRVKGARAEKKQNKQ